MAWASYLSTSSSINPLLPLFSPYLSLSSILIGQVLREAANQTARGATRLSPIIHSIPQRVRLVVGGDRGD